MQPQYIESSASKVTIKMGSREYTRPLSRHQGAMAEAPMSLTAQGGFWGGHRTSRKNRIGWREPD